MRGENRVEIMEKTRAKIRELVDEEIGKIIDNIQDEKTLPTAKRRMVLTIEFAPDKEQEMITVRCGASTKLCPPNPAETVVWVQKEDAYGRRSMVEISKEIPGQADVFDGETEG